MAKRFSFICLVALFHSLLQANAENRLALVIGCDYSGSNLELPSPTKDARAISATLKSKILGFKDKNVTLLLNPTRREMLDAIDQFGEDLKNRNTIGVFYFSGHGAQHEGKNYLIPGKAQIKYLEDLGDEAVTASRVLTRMEAANNGVNVIFLDACRSCDLPSAKKKSISRGLNQMSASGVLIGFAADANKEAFDSGVGSFYTNSLLKRIREPGVSVFEMLTKVRADVRKATEGMQEPFMYAGLWSAPVL